MKESIFAELNNIIAWGWVIGLSILGGFANFFRRVNSKKTKITNIVELFGELCISAMAGVVTYLLCRAANIDDMLTAAFVAIAGHMGTRLIFLWERFMLRNFPHLKVEESKKKDE